MRVNFISYKDTGETRTMYGVTTQALCGEVKHIQRTFRVFLKNYQEEEQIISGGEFSFESVELMDYKLDRV